MVIETLEGGRLAGHVLGSKLCVFDSSNFDRSVKDEAATNSSVK